MPFAKSVANAGGYRKRMTEYQLTFADRKTLALSIKKDLSVVVRAPFGVPKHQIDRFVLKHSTWIEQHLEARKAWMLAEHSLSQEQITSIKQFAANVMREKTHRFSEKMGVYPTGISITDAATRFGSCSAKNRICFSWRLLLYPEMAVDYVVVHELAHIRHKNHGKAFYAKVAQIMPDYRQSAALLKRPPSISDGMCAAILVQ